MLEKPGELRRTGARKGARAIAIASMGLAVLLVAASPAVAVPPPPPNPSDSELNSSKTEANARAGEVGQLTNQLAQAESKLSDLQADVELKMEEANKALVDMQTAQDEASQAKVAADNARKESDAAAGQVETARLNMDKFVAGSYQQGSTIGSISAYLGAENPKDLLARAQLLEAVGSSQLNAFEGMQQAQTSKSNKDSVARKALDIAEEKEAAAEKAKSHADTVQTVAVKAQEGQEAQNSQLEANKSAVEQKLFAAQSKVGSLQGQRQRYQDWLAQKQREEEEQARRAAESSGGPSARPSGPAARPPTGNLSASIEAVIARAMAQRGLPYAWGGGNGGGPTRGIRDGGVADRFGDYRKIGFDCSGLMIYAFAGVRSLAHYSGYQYTSGRQVPLSQMRRGDMLFWGGSPRGIHHVALYLGNGQMLEAPQSGSVVKISPVRYGGIMPFATRLIN